MVYRCVLYEHKIENGTPKWEKKTSFFPIQFEVSNNAFGSGMAKFLVKYKFLDEVTSLTSYLNLLGLFDEKNKLYFLGPILGVRGGLFDEGWKVEIHAIELLGLYEPLYTDLVAVLGEINPYPLKKAYEYLLETIGWDRAIKVGTIKPDGAVSPWTSYWSGSETPSNRVKNVARWIYETTLGAGVVHRFRVELIDDQIQEIFFDTDSWWYSPDLRVVFERSSGGVVGNNTRFEDLTVAFAKNYWNVLIEESENSGTFYADDPYGLGIPPYPVDVYSSKEIFESEDAKNKTVMRVEKLERRPDDIQSIYDIRAYYNQLLRNGLSKNVHLKAKFIGKWDDVQLFQRVTFETEGRQEQFFVGEKTLDSSGRVFVRFVKDLTEVSLNIY